MIDLILTTLPNGLTHGRNQEFFRVGEISWNKGMSIKPRYFKC